MLQGDDVLDEHCIIEHHGGNVTLIPMDGAVCTVNGQHIHDPNKLTPCKCDSLYTTMYFLCGTVSDIFMSGRDANQILLTILPILPLVNDQNLMLETRC